MIGIAMHPRRECRPDDPGPNFQLTPQTSPHLPTDSVGPLDPGQKGMLKQTDQVSTIRESNPGGAATSYTYICHSRSEIENGV